MSDDNGMLRTFLVFLGRLATSVEFNHWFIDRGWIAHPWINADAESRAVDAARSGEWELADNILADSYGPDEVRRIIETELTKLDAFKPRRSLALLALEDYRAERYHACIPVTLLLLDGMGRDQTNHPVLRQGVRLIDAETSFLELGPGAACVILDTHPQLAARDALHDALMRGAQIHAVISVDKGLDALKEVKRLGLQETLTLRHRLQRGWDDIRMSLEVTCHE